MFMTDNNLIRVTVSGSFTKHWENVEGVVKQFGELGVNVLSPVNGPPIREDDGFVYLRGDMGSPDTIERKHLSAIRQSDLLYIVNPGQYVGKSVVLEMGYALAWETAIWSQEPLSDYPHRLLVRTGLVKEAVASVRTELGDLQIPSEGTLNEIQLYVRRMAEA